MKGSPSQSTFTPTRPMVAESPTLIEGLPGHGLVASIAVDLITTQLELTHYGSITAPEFPPVVTFNDGMVRDLVRVYAGADPPVMTLQSDIALPPYSFEALSNSVLNSLSEAFRRAIFIVGAPAESESALGEVFGVATTRTMLETLETAGIPIAEEPGLVGGVTGALINGCYRNDVPAIMLVVKAHPFLPDPGAAQSLIETALEPLVEFDIDTTTLENQAGEIKREMSQIAEHYQRMMEDQQQPGHSATSSMYQ